MHANHDDEDEFDPRYLVQASDGSVFVPHGINVSLQH
jgi:hypothetical protein